MPWAVQATWDDVPHLTAEQKAKMWADTPEHMRDARAKGIPILGSGRVFPIAEETIKTEPFQIPPYMPQIVGIDFGWDHPFGASRLAWDRDNDTVYVTAVYRQREATPVIHAAAIKGWGEWLPVAWPHDGLQHDKGSGKTLASQYAAQGLDMLPTHAQWEDGGYGFEAGISAMLSRMQAGKWKVFSTCGEWFEEFRLFHRESGIVVKERDDVLSSSRIGLMALRHAMVKPKRGDWQAPGTAWVV